MRKNKMSTELSLRDKKIQEEVLFKKVGRRYIPAYLPYELMMSIIPERVTTIIQYNKNSKSFLYNHINDSEEIIRIATASRKFLHILREKILKHAEYDLHLKNQVPLTDRQIELVEELRKELKPLNFNFIQKAISDIIEDATQEFISEYVDFKKSDNVDDRVSF